MKRYLYKINSEGAEASNMRNSDYPIMPRVLAEKTAREMKKAAQRRWGRLSSWDKYRAFKTDVATSDGSPKGLKEWSWAWKLGIQ